MYEHDGHTDAFKEYGQKNHKNVLDTNVLDTIDLNVLAKIVFGKMRHHSSLSTSLSSHLDPSLSW